MAQTLNKRVAYRSLRAFSDADRGRDCQRHQIGRREGRQIGQPHAVREFVDDVSTQGARPDAFFRRLRRPSTTPGAMTRASIATARALSAGQRSR